MLLPNQFRTSLFAVAVSLLAGAVAQAVVPFTKATVSRTQNTVTFGETVGTARRPAQSGDVIRAASYLLTETDARAELKYEDGSIVRIGQNTVFTFEADTRTLSLEKGSLIFHIPKGQGGGTVRTASITAAITGTIGKCADNMIAILEGEVKLIPSGRIVPAGSFAMANPDGTITIAPFDPEKAMGGKLMEFGGPLADFDETSLFLKPRITNPVQGLLDQMETQDRTGNQPGAQQLFKRPDVVLPGTRVTVPPPTSKPGNNDGQY
ncbi:MAG: FecR family protein [Chthoniobacteraceae bacterium]